MIKFKNSFEFVSTMLYALFIIGVFLSPLTLLDKNLPNYEFTRFFVFGMMGFFVISLIYTIYRKVCVSKANCIDN